LNEHRSVNSTDVTHMGVAVCAVPLSSFSPATSVEGWEDAFERLPGPDGLFDLSVETVGETFRLG
jgi:phospholipid N-methyltransferase